MCEKEPKHKSCTECPQYDGAICQATGFQLGDKETVLASENRCGFICVDTGEGTTHNAFVMTTRIVDSDSDVKSVDDTMYHPNQPENQQWYTVEARANIGVDLDLLQEHNPNIKVIRASELEAGSPSSECPSLREGPPQKGKIDDHNSLRLKILRHPESTCYNCKKSHTEGGRLVCDKWGLQNILMPHRLCGKWAFDPLKVRAEEQQIHYAESSGLTYVENPPPLFTRDPNGYWEPVRPRSCTNCKLYNDPICMKMATHIGTRREILAKEEENGFLCFAADQMLQDK